MIFVELKCGGGADKARRFQVQVRAKPAGARWPQLILLEGRLARSQQLVPAGET